MKKLVVLLMVVFMGGAGFAGLLSITNPSFEAQTLGEGAILAGPPTGWGKVNGTHYLRNPEPTEPQQPTDGVNLLYTVAGTAQYFQIFQNIGMVINESATYKLSIDVFVNTADAAKNVWLGMNIQTIGKPSGGAGLGGVGSGLTGLPGYTTGNWFTVNLDYTPAAGDSAYAMQIYLQSAGLYMDNVRVSETIPEPTTMALLSLGGLLFVRRK